MFASRCHSSLLLYASAAASCIPRKVPLSMLLFTFSIHEMNSGFDAHSPTRHPGMLWLLDMELNSMQHSFAPGTCSSEIGFSLMMNE